MANNNTLELDPIQPQKAAKKIIRADALTRSTLATLALLFLLAFLLVFLIGEQGIGYFMLPLFVFLLGYLIYPVAVARALSPILQKRLHRDQFESVEGALSLTIRGCVISSLLFSIVLIALSEVLANNVFFTHNGFLPVAAAAVTVFLSGLQAVPVAFLSATKKGEKVLVSDLLRLIPALLISPVCAKLFYAYGLKTDALLHLLSGAFAYGSFGAVTGLVAGSLISTVYLLIAYAGAKSKTHMPAEEAVKTDEGKVASIPGVSAYAGGIIVFLLLFVFNFAMYLYGVQTTEAVALAGGVFVRACMIPFMCTAALSFVFVRSAYRLSAMVERYDIGSARALFKHLVFFHRFYAFLCAGLIAVTAETFLRLVFRNVSPEVLLCARVFSLTVAFLPFVLFATVVVLRIRKHALIYFNTAVAFALNVILLAVCLRIADLGLRSVVFTFVATVFVSYLLYLTELRVMIGIRMHFVQDVVKLLAAIFVSCGSAFLLQAILVPVVGEALTMIISMIVAVFLYLFIMILLRAISVQDLYHIPFGHAFVNLSKMFQKRK